jgi:hypothetical protein
MTIKYKNRRMVLYNREIREDVVSVSVVSGDGRVEGGRRRPGRTKSLLQFQHDLIFKKIKFTTQR